MFQPRVLLLVCLVALFCFLVATFARFSCFLAKSLAMTVCSLLQDLLWSTRFIHIGFLGAVQESDA